MNWTISSALKDNMQTFTFTEEALKRFITLSKPTQRVYLELLCLRNFKTGLTRVTQQRLADRIGVKSRSVISKALAELQAIHWIFVYHNLDHSKVVTGGLLQTFNVYRVVNIRGKYIVA